MPISNDRHTRNMLDRNMYLCFLFCTSNRKKGNRVWKASSWRSKPELLWWDFVLGINKKKKILYTKTRLDRTSRFAMVSGTWVRHGILHTSLPALECTWSTLYPKTVQASWVEKPSYSWTFMAMQSSPASTCSSMDDEILFLGDCLYVLVSMFIYHFSPPSFPLGDLCVPGWISVLSWIISLI